MQTIYLDISNKGVVPTIYAKQCDMGRKFLAIINDGGVPYAIPEDASVSVWYQTLKNNNAGTADGVTFEDNKVEISIDPVITTVSGEGILCLTISFANGDEISTWNIPYDVEVKPGTEPIEPPVPGVQSTAVLYTKQTLTPEQKAQARENIGVRDNSTHACTGQELQELARSSSLVVGDLYIVTESHPTEDRIVKGSIFEAIEVFLFSYKGSLVDGSGGTTIHFIDYLPGEIDPSEVNTKYKVGDLYFNTGEYEVGFYELTALDTESDPELIFPVWELKYLFADAGGTGFVWRGEYDLNASYSKGNAVSYNGSSYICTYDNTPTAPDDDGADWDLLAEKGYTPVKGTDYWTDADKAEIKGYVDNAILGGAW